MNQSNDDENKRSIRSFVRRTGRMTAAQQRGLDRLWLRFGIDPSQEPLDFNVLFNRKAPIIIEIGFGNGEALLQSARKHPNMDFIGIEVHKPGAGHLLNRLEQENITNVRICCDDAVEVLSQRIPNKSLSAVHLFFPDPWPKKRHHKRRIVQARFIELICHKLIADGIFYMATDWGDYAEQMKELMSANKNFLHILNPTRELSCYIERPTTKFEKRGKKLNHEIWDFVFQKKVL